MNFASNCAFIPQDISISMGFCMFDLGPLFDWGTTGKKDGEMIKKDGNVGATPERRNDSHIDAESGLCFAVSLIKTSLLLFSGGQGSPACI